MSSKIQIQKRCLYCDKTFKAQTTVTRYCSHTCNQKHYKQVKREEKIKSSISTESKTTNAIKQSMNPDINKEYLSMKETALLLGVHERTIMKMVKLEKIKSIRIGKRVMVRKRDNPYFFGEFAKYVE